MLAVTAPVLTVVEAKREDIAAGIPQCIAEMYAAMIVNACDSEPRNVYVALLSFD